MRISHSVTFITARALKKTKQLHAIHPIHIICIGAVIVHDRPQFFSTPVVICLFIGFIQVRFIDDVISLYYVG